MTALDILDALAPAASSRIHRGMEANFGMSALQLPPTEEDRNEADGVIAKAFIITRFLRKGYEAALTSDHFEQLVERVDQVLPPLNTADTIRLSVLLPFLSAAMESSTCENRSFADGKSVHDTLRCMAPEFTEFVMDSENYPDARSHAGRCLHASIARFTPRNAQECPAEGLIRSKVMPALKASVNVTRKADRAVSSFVDNVNILALLGSAAACRGGPSSKTSDQVVLFLVDLACTRKAKPLFTETSNDEIALTVFDTPTSQKSVRLSILSATAFGSILSAGCGNLLWKQRLAHISIKCIIERVTADRKPAENIAPAPSIGSIAAISHLVCSSNIQNISANHLDAIARLIASGLAPNCLETAVREDTNVIKLVLAALVKILCSSPTSFGNNVYVLVTGTMRAYATAGNMGQGSEIACKLLALQALAAIAQMGSATETLRKVKPAVISILGAAMNHPSSLLRHAAVEVRNAWYIVE